MGGKVAASCSDWGTPWKKSQQCRSMRAGRGLASTENSSNVASGLDGGMQNIQLGTTKSKHTKSRELDDCSASVLKH